MFECSECKKSILKKQNPKNKFKRRLCDPCRCRLQSRLQYLNMTEEQYQKEKKKAREYYEINKEKMREYNRKYQKKYWSIDKDKHSARFIANLMRTKILDHFGNKCNDCGSTLNLEMDHQSYQLESEILLKELVKYIILRCRICHRKNHRKHIRIN